MLKKFFTYRDATNFQKCKSNIQVKASLKREAKKFKKSYF